LAEDFGHRIYAGNLARDRDEEEGEECGRSGDESRHRDEGARMKSKGVRNPTKIMVPKVKGAKMRPSAKTVPRPSRDR
jgi:hypothetical protein